MSLIKFSDLLEPSDFRSKDQKACTLLFIRHGWKVVIVGYISGQITMQHPDSQEACFIHPDGRVEPFNP